MSGSMTRSIVNLLALPCAGASATMYLRWRRFLPAWIRLLPMELPGRGSRMAEPFVREFDVLVEWICREYAQAMQGDYVLFGHSMGALLAYGVVLRQRELSRPLPARLVVSGSSAPDARDPERFVSRDDETLSADLRKLGGTPEEVLESAELRRMALDTLQADYAVCDSFRHQAVPPLPMSVHVLAGRCDDIAQHRIYAWRQEGAGPFTLDWFDGGHFFIREREQQVLTRLVGLLAQPPSSAGVIDTPSNA